MIVVIRSSWSVTSTAGAGSTRAVEAGIDLVTLAAMLGHSKIHMVLRYAHPTQEHQTKAMDKMELYASGQKIAHSERTAPQNVIRDSVRAEQIVSTEKALYSLHFPLQ